MQFVDPRNDIAFRKIFGDEQHKGVLISFLNALLDLGGTPKEIVEVSLLNPFQVPRLEGLKLTILDIRAVDRRGIHYIVEMQVFHTQAFEKRVHHYAARAYSDQLARGADYPKLNQVIFIGIVDFVLFPSEPRYQTRHLILEEKSGEHHFKDLEFVLLELPKFRKTLADLDGVKEKWLYFVKHAEELTAIPDEMREPEELVAAFGAAQQMAWSREELDAYDMRGIYIQDERGRITFAEGKGREKGREEGREEGRRAESDLVLRQLKRRLGAVPAEHAETIRRLSLERLGELGEALLELSSLGELEAWLAVPGPGSNAG